MINLILGDCLEQMKTLADNSVDSIVSDPPYGISFMNKKWDYVMPSVDVWTEAMRVLKPGGHALIACGTRSQHRMVVNIEDAGFEIRDVISWIYGQGFPKSHNISKNIDKEAGAEREVVKIWGQTYSGGTGVANGYRPKSYTGKETSANPITEAAKQWDGWGTALKPSSEFFTLARKPLSEKTIAANVLKWGTGGINIDGCRVEINPDVDDPGLGGKGSWTTRKEQAIYGGGEGIPRGTVTSSTQGRFPANLIHDGSGEVRGLFPDTNNNSAARFFYCAKASKKDRGEGNTHNTVKPTDLMAYLCRLITPPGGTVLDPFMGSGSTGKAAIREGFNFIGIELESDYFKIAQARVRV